MRAPLVRLGLLASFGLSIGCGSTPPPAPVVAPAPPAPPPPVVVQEPDLSPVSMPQNLVGVARWKNATATLNAVQKMVRLPVDLKALAVKEIGDAEVAGVLKLDATIDVAAALDPAASEPDFSVAFSIPLTNLDQAKGVAERDGHVTQLRPGVFRIGKPKQSDDVTCDLAVSLGDAPARLVCGQNDHDLDALLPWLTRGMPSVDFGSNDLHMEVHFKPIQDRFRPMLEQGASALAGEASVFLTREFGITDPAALDAVRSTSDETVKLASDLDTISMDIKLDPDASIASLKSSVKFQSATSWFTKTLTARNDRAGAAPAIFLQAPKESDTVVYGHGTDPALWTGFQQAIPKLFSALTNGKLPDAERKAIEDLLAKLPIAVDANTVSASGHLDPAKPATAKPHGDRPMTPAELVADKREAFVQAFGWMLAGYDTKLDGYEAAMRDFVTTYNRPSLQAFIKKTMGKDASKLPTIRLVASPPGFPRGSLAIEGSVTLDSETLWEFSRRTHFEPHPKTPPAKQVFSAMIVLVPDGTRTWVVAGADPKVLKAKIDEVKNGAPSTGTIASRDGLDLLKSGPNTIGGFFSLMGIVSRSARTMKSVFSPEEATLLDGAIESMPNRGSTPILILGTGEGGATPSSSLEIRAQKGTIDDVAALTAYAIGVIAQKKMHGGSSDLPPPPPPPPPMSKPTTKKH